MQSVLEVIRSLVEELDRIAGNRGDHLLESHKRVRKLSQKGRVRYEVRPELPADRLGVYVFAPVKG